MTEWILVLVGFSVITSVKELKYSRMGHAWASGFYDILSFAIMLAAILIAWNGTEQVNLCLWN